jgi:hypothetical protein
VTGARGSARGQRARTVAAPLAAAPRRCTRRSARVALALVTVAAACVPRQLPEPRPSLVGASTGSAAPTSPARWIYHPEKTPPLRARTTAGDGTLYVGDFGERWLVDGGVHAAACRAPETLVGVQPGGMGWIYFGASGTTYESLEPLGDFVRSAAPTEPLDGVTATPLAMLGVRAGGHLFRSTDFGSTWSDVGPAGEIVVSAALISDGHGLALSVPERLYLTSDHGATWAPIDRPTSAAIAIHARGDRLYVEGAFGWLELVDPSTPTLRSAPEPTRQRGLKLAGRPARGPRAAVIASGTGALAGGRYYELVAAHRKPSGLLLRAGPVEGPLRLTRIAAAQKCREGRLAAFPPVIELACSEHPSRGAVGPLVFLRSEDDGRSWRRESLKARGSLDGLRMALGPNGELLATGACVSAEENRPCRSVGVLRRTTEPPPAATRPVAGRRSEPARSTNEGASEWFVPAVTPALRGTALALAFSSAGRAYVLGRRTKRAGLAVYVSSDAGQSFTGHDLAESSTDDPMDEESESNEETWEGEDADDGSNLTVEGFGVGDDGTLSLVLRNWGSLSYLVLDSEGRSLLTSTPPEEADLLAASGRRALAYSSSDGTAWESLDGGGSWHSDGRWRTRGCEDESEESCDVSLVCDPGGCLVGDDLTRLGWRIDPAAPWTELASPPPRPTVRRTTGTRTPIACALGTDPWVSLQDTQQPPTASQAALGDTAWYAIAENTARGSAGAWTATGGARARVSYVPLLPAATRPSEIAQAVRLQVEGVATLRYRLPTPSDPQLGGVEVAWLNLFEGGPRHATLGRRVSFRPADFQRQREGVQRATPAFLSIASGGIYLRPHLAEGDRQPTYFLDGRTVEEVPPLTWPEGIGDRVHSEIAHLGGHVPFLSSDRGFLARATRTGDRWTFGGISVGVNEPSRLGLNQGWELTYSGKNVGIVARVMDYSTGQERAWFHPISAGDTVTLPAVPIPTQSSLEDPPRACSAEQRASTPRSVAPAVGPRHPVIIADAREPLRLLMTDDAVVHGTPEHPCVAAFDAVSVGPSRATQEALIAILPMGDLDHAWLFRTIIAGGEPSGVEYRPMGCRLDPGAEVPEELTADPRAPAR